MQQQFQLDWYVVRDTNEELEPYPGTFACSNAEDLAELVNTHVADEIVIVDRDDLEAYWASLPDAPAPLVVAKSTPSPQFKFPRGDEKAMTHVRVELRTIPAINNLIITSPYRKIGARKRL